MRPQIGVIIYLVFSLKQEHTSSNGIDEVKSCFINLPLSMGIDGLIISKPLNSLPIEFLRTNGLNHNRAIGSGGDSLINLSTSSQCARIDEKK